MNNLEKYIKIIKTSDIMKNEDYTMFKCKLCNFTTTYRKTKELLIEHLFEAHPFVKDEKNG